MTDQSECRNGCQVFTSIIVVMLEGVVVGVGGEGSMRSEGDAKECRGSGMEKVCEFCCFYLQPTQCFHFLTDLNITRINQDDKCILSKNITTHDIP